MAPVQVHQQQKGKGKKGEEVTLSKAEFDKLQEQAAVGAQVQAQQEAEAQKAKSAQKPKADLSAEEVAAVDSLATLEGKIVWDDVKQYEKDKKTLAESVKDKDRFDPAERVVLQGKTGVVTFSAASKATAISDMNGLIGALRKKFVESNGGDPVKGYEALIGALKIDLATAKKYLTAAELSAFTTEDPHGGSRTCEGGGPITK